MVQRANGASANTAQTNAIDTTRFAGMGEDWLSARKRRAGARATATSAPSGRSSAAKVTAKVKVSASFQEARSWNRQADQRASAMVKSVGHSVSGFAA